MRWGCTVRDSLIRKDHCCPPPTLVSPERKWCTWGPGFHFRGMEETLLSDSQVLRGRTEMLGVGSGWEKGARLAGRVGLAVFVMPPWEESGHWSCASWDLGPSVCRQDRRQIYWRIGGAFCHALWWYHHRQNFRTCKPNHWGGTKPLW